MQSREQKETCGCRKGGRCDSREPFRDVQANTSKKRQSEESDTVPNKVARNFSYQPFRENQSEQTICISDDQKEDEDVSCDVETEKCKDKHESSMAACNCGCDSDSYLKKMLDTSKKLAPCSEDNVTKSQLSPKLQVSHHVTGQHIVDHSFKYPTQSVSNADLQTQYRGEPLINTVSMSPVDRTAETHKLACYTGKVCDLDSLPDYPRDYCETHSKSESLSQDSWRRSPMNSKCNTILSQTPCSPTHHINTDQNIESPSKSGPPPLIQVDNDEKCLCCMKSPTPGMTKKNQDISPQTQRRVGETPLDLTVIDEPLDLSLKATNLIKVPHRRVSTGTVKSSNISYSGWPTCHSAPATQDKPKEQNEHYNLVTPYKEPPPYPGSQISRYNSGSQSPRPSATQQTTSHFTYPDTRPLCPPMELTPGHLYHSRNSTQNYIAPCQVPGIGRGRIGGATGLQEGVPAQSNPVPGPLHAAYLMLAPKPVKRGRGRPRTPKSLKALEDALKVKYDLEDILCLVCNICSAYFTRVATLYSHFSKAHEVPLCMDYITVRTITEVRGAIHHHGLNNADVQMMFAQLEVFNAGNLKASPNSGPNSMPPPPSSMNYTSNPNSTYNSFTRPNMYQNYKHCAPHPDTREMGTKSPIIQITTPPPGCKFDKAQDTQICINELKPDGQAKTEKDTDDKKGNTNSSQNGSGTVLSVIGDFISQHCVTGEKRKRLNQAQHEIDDEKPTKVSEEIKKESFENNNFTDTKRSPEREKVVEVDSEDCGCCVQKDTVNNNVYDDSEKDNSRSDEVMNNNESNTAIEGEEMNKEIAVKSIKIDCVQECNSLRNNFTMNSDMGELFGGRLCIDLNVG